MKATPLPQRPIGVLSSLTTGLDAIIQSWWIILFPLALDALLWFGPRLSISDLAKSMVNEYGADLGDVWGEALLEGAQRFNALSLLGSTPLGIPSLMAIKSPILSPLGNPLMVQVSNPSSWMLLFFAFTIIGILLGGVFLGLIAQIIRDGQSDPQRLLRLLPRYWGSMLLFILIAMLALVGIAIPIALVLTLLSSLSSAIAALVLWAAAIMFMWAIFQLVFVVHGMLLREEPLRDAVRHSMKIVTFSAFPTMILFLLLVGISSGLGYIWSLPDEGSWMQLVGIGGHAIISSSLVAATFVYYQDRYRYWQELSLILSPSNHDGDKRQ